MLEIEDDDADDAPGWAGTDGTDGAAGAGAGAEAGAGGAGGSRHDLYSAHLGMTLSLIVTTIFLQNPSFVIKFTSHFRRVDFDSLLHPVETSVRCNLLLYSNLFRDLCTS